MFDYRLDAEKAPKSHILIVVLFFIGIISLPLDRLFNLFMEDTTLSYLLSQTIIRLLLAIFMLVYLFKYKFNGGLKGIKFAGAFLTIILALLVAINNAPIIGVIKGNVKINADTSKIIVYLLYCLSIGIVEEITFRGIIFPLCVLTVHKSKHTAFYCVFNSSAIFALTHIVNIFTSSIPAVILQVGYSFLIGALCCATMIETKNLILPIIIHFIYDVGGLATSVIASGNQWDTLTVVITAVFGVIVAIYFIIRVFNYKVEDLYFFDRKGKDI